MTRRSATDLQTLLLQAQQKLERLSTDHEWGVRTTDCLAYDAPGLAGLYVIVIRNRNAASLRRLAGYRSADIVYRARLDNCLLLFCQHPESLTSPLLAAARNDGLDVLTAYGKFSGCLNSIPTV